MTPIWLLETHSGFAEMVDGLPVRADEVAKLDLFDLDVARQVYWSGAMCACTGVGGNLDLLDLDGGQNWRLLEQVDVSRRQKRRGYRR